MTQQWMALPGRCSPWASFRHSLTDLAAALDLAVPADVQPDRKGCWTVKQLVLQAIEEQRPLPDKLFAPVLGAAINHPDPSHNARFVLPLLGDFGRRRVQLALIDIMRNGTEQDRPGAANAWYHTFVPSSQVKGGIPNDGGADLGAQWDEACLHAFLSTEDIDVRRAIVGILMPDPPESFAEHLRALAAEMVAQVRASGDTYMNSRIGPGWPDRHVSDNA